MKKSIYDDVLDDLNWVMSDEFDDIQRHPKLNKYQRLDMFIGLRNTLEQVFEQAQKQARLLELYIELANKIEVIDNAYGYGILGFDEIKHISEKIKELENNEINLR